MIPFIDLKTQYHGIKEEIDAAIERVLESSQFALGAEVAAFEKEFTAYCHAGNGIGVNSGTSALHLALLAAGVGPGDEVITVPFTFIATVAAICYTGAKPVFVDVEPRTLTMDVGRIEEAITERTKVVLPVHLYGHPADMDPILDIAARHNLIVIEDAAQAHGAEYRGRRVGSLGEMGCFSFYPGKNLGAYGEGGMVVTDNRDFESKIRMLRDWGQESKGRHLLKGYNYRMEGLQGAILRVKLRYLKEWTEARRSHADLYSKLLVDNNIQTPLSMPYGRHAYHIYAIRLRRRDAVVRALREDGIQCGIHYPIPVHLQPAHLDLGYRAGDFPVSEQAAASELSLPMFAELQESQIKEVARSVRTALSTEEV